MADNNLIHKIEDLLQEATPQELYELEKTGLFILEPHTTTKQRIEEWKDNRGVWFEKRALIDDLQGKSEVIFSDVIKDFSESGDFHALLRGPDCRCVGKDELQGAFTIFQWLTTNIGKSVLEEAQRKVKELEMSERAELLR